MNNDYILTEGDHFFYKPGKYVEPYTLLKREDGYSVCLNENTNEETIIKESDFLFLGYKKESDEDFLELYNYIQSMDSSAEKFIDNNTRYITFGNYIIYYNKLNDNCEVTMGRWEIFNRKKDVKDLTVINIFEDDWKSEIKRDIIKSRVTNFLGKSKKIYARKCEIKEISSKEKKVFMDNSHLQGDIRSRVNIGLFYEGELVSAMSLGSLRKNMGQLSKEGSFELLRFANKKYYTVIGGASKLFKYFLRNNEVSDVISYADRSWSDGNLYMKIGFQKEDSKVHPNYFYNVNGVRKNRFGFRKNLLVEQGFDPNMTEVNIQHSRGMYRIFDLGSLKFKFYNK